MDKRILGRTGVAVSEIAFGGVEIGMPYGIGVESEKDMLSEKDAIGLLHKAVDDGINFFDTARLYGRSEEIMGKAFKGMRDKVVICTKSTHLRRAKDDDTSLGSIGEVIRNSLNDSLTALQTDYVDIFMLHNATVELMSDANVIKTFEDLRKSGKVRSIAVSTYEPEESEYAIVSDVWDLVQLPFNLLDQRQRVLFTLAGQKKVAIVVRSVLFKGLLSGRAEKLTHPELDKVKKHIDLYRELLDEEIADLPTLATKFALSFSAVSSVLVGIDRIKYLDNAIRTADGKYLKDKKLSRALELAYANPEFLNLHNWDVMGWLK